MLTCQHLVINLRQFCMALDKEDDDGARGVVACKEYNSMLFTISDCLKNLLSWSDVRSEWDNRSWVAVPSFAPIPISFGSRSLGAQFQWHPLLSPISKIGLSGRDEMAKQLVHGGRPRQPDILDLVSKQKFITRSTTEDSNGLMTPHPFLETRPLVGLIGVASVDSALGSVTDVFQLLGAGWVLATLCC
ncbi:hypothetical protein Nepgr_009317 [Nepenthes gracilis]|uniref:Uncharacterized protein n=1 Tax=Nepenthes gracilis TaxID=150966 RepID=A0AAD3SAN1_NEPGR|nr:hypothetical protein Nepgr_009317 [Nepenthes gracilis]